jgi:hypothetical protein
MLLLILMLKGKPFPPHAADHKIICFDGCRWLGGRSNGWMDGW